MSMHRFIECLHEIEIFKKYGSLQSHWANKWVRHIYLELTPIDVLREHNVRLFFRKDLYT